jgi:hypothetical protein
MFQTEAGLSDSGPPHGTDQAVAAAVGRLRQSAYPALRKLACDYAEGEVILRGQVPSYYLKQVAQSLVAGGGLLVINRIHVVSRQQRR